MDSSLSSNRKIIKNFSIIIIAAIFILIIYTSLGTWLFNRSEILPNVFINDINVGRLTPSEARLKINEEFKRQLDEFIIQLSHDKFTWKLTHRDIDLYYLLDDSVKNAFKVGREGNCFHRIKTIFNLKSKPKVIKLNLIYNPFKIDDKIDSISKTINKPAINAKIESKDKNFVIIKETVGIEIDKEYLRHNIIDAVNNFNSTLINIRVKGIKPKIMEEDLNNIKDLVGDSITRFNGKDKGRTENIKIAVNAIDNTILMPEEEFSFNDSTGPRSAEAGYKEASVIVNGEFVTGIGGGICQVSTTLYQAALISDVEIISRRNHGLPVSYVPMGQDATVAYEYIDLKFKNNKKHPIYIESFVKGEEVHVKLYSKKTDNLHINLKSEILSVIEPKMQVKKDKNMYLSESKVSKEGKKGYRVATYKIYLQEGREVKRKLVTKDYYPPKDGIIIKGTKEE